MAKLKAENNPLLDPDTYLLEVLEAEPINVYQPQIQLRLRVAAGEHKGFTFVDYANCGSEHAVRALTKSWDVFEACLNRRLSESEELDTDNLIGKRFVARVLVRPSGRGNYCEHGSIAPYRPEKVEPKDQPESEKPSALAADGSFNWDS